jgi:large repetitive protein
MRLVRLVSVTAVVTATCALWALPASAATAASNAKRPSTTTVSISPSPAWVGASERLSATVRSSGRTPRGTVTFRWAGRTLCVATLTRGSASCHARFGARGSYLIRAFYSGDATHAGSVGTTRLAVRRSPTVTTITDKAPA